MAGGTISVLRASNRQSLSESVLWGFGAALLLSWPSYWSLSWALNRSNKIFYSIFVAGTLFRLTGFAAAAYGVFRTPRLSMAAVLLSLVCGIVVSSFIEMYFIQKEAKQIR
jgi:hypothetical protein